MKAVGSLGVDSGETVSLGGKQVAAFDGIDLRQLRHTRVAGAGPKLVKVSGQIGRSVGRMLCPIGPTRVAIRSASGGQRYGDPG